MKRNKNRLNNEYVTFPYENNDLQHEAPTPPATATTSMADRFTYDEIGNLIKDATNSNGKNITNILWTLYGKVKGINYSNSEADRFEYEPNGNRYKKSYLQNISTSPYIDAYVNEYYIRDASGNILAIYKQKQKFKYEEPYVQLAQTLSPMASFGQDLGTVLNDNANFTNNFIGKILVDNVSFATSQMAGKTPGFYLANNDAIKQNMLATTPSLLDDLMSTQSTSVCNTMSSSFSPDFLMHLWLEEDAQLKQSYIALLVPDQNQTEIQRIYDALIDDGGIVNSAEEFTAFFENFQTIKPQNVILDKLALAFDPSTHATEWNATVQRFMNNSDYRNQPQVKTTVAAKLAASGDEAMLAAYYNNLSNASSILRNASTANERLTTVYDNDKPAFINAHKTIDNNNAVMGGALKATFGSNFAQLTSLLVTQNATVANVLQPVIKSEHYYLAEHHMYGSSRLGIKNYWPNHYSFEWDDTKPNTIEQAVATSQLLSMHRPWYSQALQSLISSNQTDPYNNQNTDQVVSTRVIGLKNYELTNHLGNVMTVLSDKQIDKANNPSATLFYNTPLLASRQPAITAAYDYYPFGMLMPHRFLQDNTLQCTPITTTSYSTKWIKIFEINMADESAGSLAQKMSGFETTGITLDPLIGEILNVQTNTPGSGTNTGFYINFGNATPDKEMKLSIDIQNYAPENDAIIALEQYDGTEWQMLVSTSVRNEANASIAATPSSNQALRVSVFGVDLYAGISTIKMERHDVFSSTTTTTICKGEEDKDYRFGFNGQHKDNEVAGIGNHNSALFGEYDTRLGRRWNLDPKPNESLSEYSVFGNNPISYTDVLLDTPTSFQKLRSEIYDWLPVVNECKGIVELFTGEDAVTGEPIELGWRILGAIPGGKYVEKSAKLTKIVVKKSDDIADAGKKMQELKKKAVIGQEAHRQIQKKITDLDPNVKIEQKVILKDRTVRKDFVRPDGTKGIIKPNTPSGQKAAKSRENLLKKNNHKTETIFYDPANPAYKPNSPTYIGPKIVK